MKYYLNRVYMTLKSMDEYIKVLIDEFKIIKETEDHYWADQDERYIDKYYIEINTIEDLEKLRGVLYEYNKSNMIFKNQGWDRCCNSYDEPTLVIFDDIIG